MTKTLRTNTKTGQCRAKYAIPKTLEMEVEEVEKKKKTGKKNDAMRNRALRKFPAAGTLFTMKTLCNA